VGLLQTARRSARRPGVPQRERKRLSADEVTLVPGSVT
jgi:hypothetical protein